MKARLVPLYFSSEADSDFITQARTLAGLFEEHAQLLDPQPLGSILPDADAVLFPQVLGDAYRRATELRGLTLPILVLTSRFGTVEMWDWEVISYWRAEGVAVMAPYSLDQVITACRALAAKRELSRGTFVVYQDDPGGTNSVAPEIPRRFYWWQDGCAERIEAKFGLKVVKKSFEELGRRAKAIPAAEANREWDRLRDEVPLAGVGGPAKLNAIQLYRAVRDDLDAGGTTLAAGINCLNESSFSDTTPCLAWDLLYEERDLIWGCEADLMSMLTKFILHRSLRIPVMMTNLYPFLSGQAALNHERISEFPPVDEPDNYVLAAHCGYLGVLPRAFATEWRLRPKVLSIIDENATAIDARLPVGDIMLSKLGPTLENLVTVEGELTGYAGYPGSDFRNGAVIRVPDGHALMEGLPSHHSILTTGHDLAGFKIVGQVFGLKLDDLGA
ncbi:MAG TPA: hypothetical protein VEJ84_12235 [Acidimicrobiales bacterium]|nr:hypothetical protein [Acidimicrobiales bacterium]